MYAIKPKFHMFVELSQYSSEELGNPMLFWEYRDEDFMGFVGQIAFRRGGAAHPSTTSFQVLRRYRLYLSDPAIKP